MNKKLFVLTLACCLATFSFADNVGGENGDGDCNSNPTPPNPTTNNDGKGGPNFDPTNVNRSKACIFFFDDEEDAMSVSSSNGLITIHFDGSYSNVCVKVFKDGNVESYVGLGNVTCGNRSLFFSDDSDSNYVVVVEADGSVIFEDNL